MLKTTCYSAGTQLMYDVSQLMQQCTCILAHEFQVPNAGVASRRRCRSSWVWLLWNDGPGGGIKAPLILFDVEFPIAIKVSREINGSELDDGLGHLRGPAHA